MAVKVDLAKAYDQIEWSFIHKVLKAFHFPQSLIELIMSCVTTTSVSILFNGSKLNSFKPFRGIRQGDPLSPYLFILCMEYLGALIEKECIAKRWIPMKASRDNVAFSHLFFADDLMLFAKVSKEGCEAIKVVLDVFCAESGQKISLEKSRIYFSLNVPSDIKDEVSEYLGIHATTNTGRYLSFPLRHKGATRRQFNFVAKRVISKLAGWKAKFLSFAGRTVLIKSVMTAIPNYVMQVAAFPMHLCDKLDKINRDFLWGSSPEKRKLHLVGWSKIIKSKEKGGLGIQAAKAKNIALLAKLNWRLYKEKESLWARVILQKYCSSSRRNSKDPDKLPCSPCWVAIKEGFPIFEKGVCWSASKNSKLNFWGDKWVKGNSLRSLVEGPLTQDEAKLTTDDMFQDGSWRWDFISFDLPNEVKEKIYATPMQIFGDRKDSLLWKSSLDGDFSMTLAYASNFTAENNPQIFMGNWVWKVDIWPKISSFLWLCHHNSVPVRQVVAACGINCDTTCPLCNNQEETILHLLRDCPFAVSFGQAIKTPLSLLNLCHLNLTEWLKKNCLDSN